MTKEQANGDKGNDQEPDTWHSPNTELPELPHNNYEAETYESENFARELEVFCKVFNTPTRRVYYPGSNADTTLSKIEALKGSKKIHLDIAQNAVIALQNAGLEAHVGDAEEFDPGDIDILILKNFSAARPPNFVVPGGFVLCNDWWEAATDMKQRRDYELLAILRSHDETDDIEIDSDNLGDYWKEVESDEEFQGSSEYLFERAQQAVQKYFGTTENILSHYQQLHDEGYKTFGTRDIAPDGNTLYPIPRKKQGGLFVYRRKQPEPPEQK